MCAREHALAAHSEQSHVKAIIISPPAITATSDSPLPAKLISPSFQVCHPPSCLHQPDQRISLVLAAVFFLLFFVPPFPQCLAIQGKASFPLVFFPLFLLRGCCALLRCVSIQSITVAAGHGPHLQRRKEYKKVEIGRRFKGTWWLFLVVLALQKPICTSFPLKSSRQRRAQQQHSGLEIL